MRMMARDNRRHYSSSSRFQAVIIPFLCLLFCYVSEAQDNATCSSDEFTCGNGRCIPIGLRCDFDYDCLSPDTSDEENCESVYPACSAIGFRCTNGRCIYKSLVCDSHYDCSDESDEVNCTRNNNATCSSDEFTCGNGRCIPIGLRCDFDYDCLSPDTSDEENCESVYPACSAIGFRCTNGRCIYKSLVCDSHYDCSDESDEVNCTRNTDCSDTPTNVNHSTHTDNGSIATYVCDIGYLDTTGAFIWDCMLKDWEAGGVLTCSVAPEEPAACNVSLDYRGKEWPITYVDITAEQECPSQTLGTVMRKCKNNGEWATANYSCVQETIRTIQQQIYQAQNGSGSANVTSLLGDLAHATDIDELLEGDMLAVIDTLASVAVVAEESITAAGETETETQNFLGVASNLLDEKHKDTWDADIDKGQPGAIDVAQVVEKFIKAKVKQLSSSTNESFTKHYNNTNIFCEIGRRSESDTSAYTFPNRGAGLPSWIEDTTTALYIPAESFSGMAREYSSQVYRNLPDIVVNKLQTNGQIQDSGSMDINSDVTIAFQSQQPVTNLDPPARITFQHSSTNYSRPICVFWDFGQTTWSSQGCEMVSTSDTHTVCACDHFTNFAVLMSPGKTPGADQLALSIISAIGCGVSLLCLVCTVAAHLRVWRLVKSDRSTLLMHLCVALIVAYAVFLAGINRAENKDVCTAIAALLHYFWLVVFFLMLAEGIEIAVSVIYVFVTKSRVKWLVLLAWGVPAVIVGVSLGVSRLDGYGTDTFCWLSTESGLLWAFVGPAAFVILVNFLIIIAVFKKMLSSSKMLRQTYTDKAKTGVRSLCVLMPVLGISWVFGIFSVNEDFVAFQYIFATCNAIQGIFIFLFHCIFNRQLKDAWKQTQIRKQSLASFEDSYNKQRSSDTGSTTYYSPDGSRKQSNDTQADRQMQELAKKQKMGSSNIFTPNNKLDKDKKPNIDVALEDVKIFNILRESEVMGEATGISSILNTPDKQPASDRATTRTEEVRMQERHDRMTHVYTPYMQGGRHSSQDISEALPTTYKPKQMRAKLQQPEATRQTCPTICVKSKEAAQAKKNMAKKKSPKDRLGPQSRHSSLENMSSHDGYSPYSGMHSGLGHSGSRPAHQTPSQWDQYSQYGRTRPQQRRGDYW